MRACLRIILASLCMVLPHGIATAGDAAPLTILRVTPDGEDVPAGKQIVFQFDQPVVALGVMERPAAEIPVTITPPLPCEWRWLDTSALACNLPDKHPLQTATRYRYSVKPGITTLQGAGMTETYEGEFITERPQLRYENFYQWRSPTLPVLRLVFNQPVSKASVEAHIFFALGDNADGERIALTARPDVLSQQTPKLLPVPGDNYALFFADTTARKSDEDYRSKDGMEFRRVWLVQPTNELPSDTRATLMTEKGLLSALGPETGVIESPRVAFSTYPEFAFLGLRCESNQKTQITVSPGQTAQEKCNPQAPVNLLFSTPVHREKVLEALTSKPLIHWQPPKSDAEDEEGEETLETADEYDPDNPRIGWEYKREHERGKQYEVYLPAGLKAAQNFVIQSKAETLNGWQRFWLRIKSWFVDLPRSEVRDIFDRSLTMPLQVGFATDHRLPNSVLPYSNAVLESGVDSELPFYVNNLRNYHMDFARLQAGGSGRDSYSHSVPAVQDVQFAVPLGIRDMLRNKSGALYGWLTTDPVTRTPPYALFAQVTPYQVHAKLGHFSSLVWVTDFATGQPVSGARVSILRHKLTEIDKAGATLANATTGEDGTATLPGMDTLDPALKLENNYSDSDERLMVKVQKGQDLALLPMSYDFEINAWRLVGDDDETVYPSNEAKYGHMRAWGTTAQGIYRAGDTMQYKIYLRQQDNRRFVPPPHGTYRLKIIDPMGKTVADSKGLSLSEFGGLSGEYTIPKEASVGWYRFMLLAEFDHESKPITPPKKDRDGSESEEDADSEDYPLQWQPMQVLVSDFTPSPFRVSNTLNGDRFEEGSTVSADTHATLHSGGAYNEAAVRVTALVEDEPFRSKHALLKPFTFSDGDDENTQQIFQKEAMLDDKGEFTVEFPASASDIVYGKLMVESAVADDRGKYVAGRSSAAYFGVDRLVGMRLKDWLAEVGKPATVDYAVADTAGNPVTGTKVTILIEKKVTKSARVKGSGSAYLTEYESHWQKLSECNGESAAEPRPCQFTPDKAGSYRVVAMIEDTKGRANRVELSTYAIGGDYVNWDDGGGYGLTIVPHNDSYKIGDTARFLVKNPYPGAKALVSVERYGVLDHFVQALETSTPVIEIPIKPDYVPGFYLSVTVMSPRVEKPVALVGQLDLGKPAFRAGYLEVPVRDPHKEMLITAKAEHEIYKPRETVRVALHAEPRFKEREEPIEYAVAVLDGSVFDLIGAGRDAFDPYKGFYILDPLDLSNYSLLMQLVGRQKFEKKGANPGGDGGGDLSMRSLFKFVSYWNPSLPADASGNASIEFAAPDNLTGWRVLALAMTPSDRFGLGEGNFKVNRPTEIRPALPNQLRETDRFDAAFTVMNRTDHARDIAVRIEATGDIDSNKTNPVHEETLQLEPYKRATVRMPVITTAIAESRDVPEGEVRFAVTARDAEDGDGITHTLPVRKRRNLETAANYGSTTEDEVKETIQFPADMLPDVGSVSVVLSPSVLGNITGALRYMRDYPYLCWEQRLSKGVMAAHYRALKNYLPKEFVWEGADSLPQATLDSAASFQAPNGGMAYFRAEDSYVDPYLSAFTALAFHWLREDGYTIPEAVESRLHTYLSTLLKNNAVPDFYSEGMTATVRAVALNALAQRGNLDSAELERYRPHVPRMSLLGKSQYLQALVAAKQEDAAPAIADMLLASGNQTGGKFTLNETWDDSYSRILASPLRENCTALSALTRYATTPVGRTEISDVPMKLARSIVAARGNRDHWENTQENMFCLQAMVDYARVYEATPPDMTARVALRSEPLGEATFHALTDPAQTVIRPNGKADVGQQSELFITRDGEGRLYYATRLQYALPYDKTKPANAGIEIAREYSVQREGKWRLLKSPYTVARGELVRVDLFVSVPAARNFVVVDDAVPGGLEPVNRDLATASTVDADEAEFKAAGGSFWFKYDDWQSFGASRWSFYHQELKHDAARFYADYLPPGNYHLSYTAQAIASGEFSTLPARAEEMYDPDIYGLTAASALRVNEPAATSDNAQP